MIIFETIRSSFMRNLWPWAPPFLQNSLECSGGCPPGFFDALAVFISLSHK